MYTAVKYSVVTMMESERREYPDANSLTGTDMLRDVADFWMNGRLGFVALYNEECKVVLILGWNGSVPAMNAAPELTPA